MFSVKYATVSFVSENGKSCVAEISYEEMGGGFDIEDINIDGAIYDMTKQSFARRNIITEYMSAIIDVWESVMEYNNERDVTDRESYDLRNY